MSGVARRIGVVASIAAAVGLGVGAGYIAFSPDPERETSVADAPLTVEAVQGTVGRTIPVAIAVDQPFTPIATNTLAGVVTAVGAEVIGSGDVLYEVAGVPVRAIEGCKPMYRDLAEGAKGQDVAQMQRALTAWGFPVADDGDFGPATRSAVMAWQKSVGQERTGVVPLGTMLALPSLPTSFRLGESVLLGLQLMGGEPAVLVRAEAPTFSVLTTTEVGSLVHVGAAATISSGAGDWAAVVASASLDQNGQYVLDLLAPDGGTPCGSACADLPPEDALSLTGSLVIAPEVTGVVVPVGAIQSDASGALSVVLEDGTTEPVTVVASEDGRAVVEGVEAGQRVRVSEPLS